MTTPRPTRASAETAQSAVNAVLTIRRPASKLPVASCSATNLLIAVERPRSRKLTYAPNCRIRTHAPYSAVDILCTRNGGRTSDTSMERKARSRFEADPWRTRRLFKLGIGSVRHNEGSRVRRLHLAGALHLAHAGKRA